MYVAHSHKYKFDLFEAWNFQQLTNMILLKGDPVLTNDVFLVSAESEHMIKEKDLTRPDFSNIHVAAGFAFDINLFSS